jgi:hypothetical protein
MKKETQNIILYQKFKKKKKIQSLIYEKKIKHE